MLSPSPPRSDIKLAPLAIVILTRKLSVMRALMVKLAETKERNKERDSSTVV